IEKVLSLQEEELKFLDNVRNCINIRIRCDRDYASSLLMVAVCGQKCHFNDNIGNTNIGTVWRTIADETHELSKLMANSADELTHEVLELIDELVSEKKALRKSLIDEYNRYCSQLDNSCQRIQSEYEKCLTNYKSTKTKYEDIWLRLPKKTEHNANINSKIEKQFIDIKRKYEKLCQRLHVLHNDYCLVTTEAKQYENDFRLLLIPALISYHESILMDSDITQENSNIYGNLKGKLTKPMPPHVAIGFNDKLLDDFVGALKPNQLIIDTESELQHKLTISQLEIRDKRNLQKQYEQEMRTLLPLSEDNENAKMGIKIRKRAIDIVKKDLLFIETQHERTHQLWERVDVSLTKISGLQVPNGLELNLTTPHKTNSNTTVQAIVNSMENRSMTSVSTTQDTTKSYSSLSNTMSWGRTFLTRLKRQKMSGSVSTLTSVPSTTISHNLAQRREKDETIELCDEEWFHGSLPRSESNKLLLKMGDFMVRESLNNGQPCYVVSVLWNGFRHFIISTDSQMYINI
ncbi:unnamed protein product, partial [Medioppia subpectinata]